MLKFKFLLYNDHLEKIEGTASSYHVPGVEIEAVDAAEALEKLKPQIPEGSRLLTWWLVVDNQK